MPEAALGIRAHSGWAMVAAVAGSMDETVVLARTRIETADAAIAGSRQPFHAAAGLTLPRAEAMIGTCRESSTALATRSIRDIISQLAHDGRRVVACGILTASGRPLPDLAATLRSHALIHTAEGEFFREILAGTCEHANLPVTKMPEREVWQRAAAVSRLGIPEVQHRVNQLGRALGPPWRQDEKLAALVGWIALDAARHLK